LGLHSSIVFHTQPMLQKWLSPYHLSDKKDRAHAAAIHKAFVDCKPLPLQLAPRKLIKVLRASSGLVNLRIVPIDDAKYLGSWLTPEQKLFIEARNEFPWHSTTHHYPCKSFWLSPSSTKPRIYRSARAGLIIALLRAILISKVVVQVLRYSHRLWELRTPWPLRITFHSLRTLRIEVHVRAITDFTGTRTDLPFLKVLKTLRDLKELVNNLDDHYHYSHSYSRRKLVAPAIFVALTEVTKLHHVALQGHWIFSPAPLLSFVRIMLQVSYTSCSARQHSKGAGWTFSIGWRT
jgi:hypothetical protein